MKKCLIIIDFQNDFVEGSLGFEGTKNLDLPIYNKAMDYIKNNDDIIFTLDCHYDDTYLDTNEGLNLPIKHCIKDSYGYQIYGFTCSLQHVARKVFEKGTFGSIELANYLRDKDYSEITFCGLVSNICVLTNAIITKTLLPEAKIIVDASLVGSNNLELQEKSFDILENLHINVVNRIRG